MRLLGIILTIFSGVSGIGRLPSVYAEVTDSAANGDALRSSETGPAGDSALDAFERGKALYKESLFIEASDSFREAFRLRPSWRLLYNLGQAEAAAKRLGLALEAFEAYLAKGGDEVETARAEEVRAEIRRLRDLVGFIDVKGPEGADIIVDNVSRGRSPLPGAAAVTAGVVHVVYAEKDGSKSATREVKVSGGQTSVVDLRLPSFSSGDASGPPENGTSSTFGGETGSKQMSVVPDSGKGADLLGWSMAGVGAVLLLGAVGTGVTALALDGDIENGCPGGGCDSAWTDKLETRDRLAVSTNVLLGIGSAALAAGVVILVVKKARGRESRSLSLNGAFGAERTGAQLKWTF